MVQRARRATVTRRVLRGFDPGRLRRRRLALNLSRGDVARAAGITVAAVQSWETGRSQPQVDTLARAATALDVSIAWLVRVPEKQRYLGDLRVLQGLTQVELAVKIGMATSKLGSIERGETRMKPDVVEALAEALDADTDEVSQAWERARDRPMGTSA